MAGVFRYVIRNLCCTSSNGATWGAWSQIGGYMNDDVSSTSWLWSLHADAHDFPNQVTLNGLVASRIFATHFGHLSVVAAWFSALCFGSARYGNYMAWVAEPLDVKPSAQIVYAAVNSLQDVLNGDAGASTSGIRITSGVFQVWRAAGITSQEQLFSLAAAFLLFAVACLVAGWYHNHRAVPTVAWFNDVDAILSHHLSAVIGLGCIAWAGHLVHVAVPTDAFLRLGVDPEAAALGLSPFMPGVQDVLLGNSVTDLITLNWTGLDQYVTTFGGLNPATGSLWLSDVVHHHLALGTLALLAGHMYRTQYYVGTELTSLLVAHRAVVMN